MGGSYSRLGCVRSHQDDHQLDGSDERGFGVTLMNPVKSVDSASTHSSSSRQSRATYVYESDWSDVVAMKRKWEEDYALTVELPPVENEEKVLAAKNESMCKQELQSPSKNEEQAGSMAVRGNQIEKRRKKESHKKRLSHSGRGLVKCEELSCSVSVRSKQIPSGGHKLQWVFKLYDMESSRSLDEREVPTLMKSVCDMLSAQVERSRVPPAHKRFKVRLNIMQHQSRLKPVRSSNSRFVLRKMRKSETVTCHSHGDECTSCATYAASDEQSLCLTERRLRQVENKESELRDDDLRKQISVRQRRRIGHGNGSSSNPELRSRCHQKSSRRRSLNGDQSRDNSQSASKKTGNKHDRRRSSLPSNSLPGVSTDEVVVQTTKKQFPLASPVKLRHQGRGGSKRHSCHAAFIAENICHRKSEVMSEKLYEKVQTVTKQEVVPSSDSSESVVHHHHHHEHHHHHYHVYHQL